MERLDEAIQILPRRGCSRLRTNNQLNRGVFFLRLGEIESARAVLLEAQLAAQTSGLRTLVASIKLNLGHVYRMEGNYEIARDFYEGTLRSVRNTELHRHHALALEFLAEAHIDEGRGSEALRLLDEAQEIATSLASHGDLMMEILRRRGEAKVAIGQISGGIEDLERTIALCESRGEVRERILAQRSLVLAAETSIENFAERCERILQELKLIADRFEFARTVCRILEDGRMSPAKHPWVNEAFGTAAHYFASMGLKYWKDRLHRVAGHGVPLQPDRPISASATKKKHPRSTSPAYTRALEAARLAAQSREPALILGETGVGKEVFASLVHKWSTRASKPLVGINCGAIPENLIESELFGHVRGAFTGADRDRSGLFETADGGTVLLDEIGDLPIHVQVRLLRFLDHYEFRRVGEGHAKAVDVRILAATHKDLWKLVRSGVFREDLLFRLNVFRIQVPALRDRPEDIPGLVTEFLAEGSHSSREWSVAPDLMRWLQAHDWPGNVRELRNLCRYLSVRCWGMPEIGVRDLPADVQASCVEFLGGAHVSKFEREKRDFERKQIERALQETSGSISEASRLLGLGRNNLARKMRDHGIERDTFLRR